MQALNESTGNILYDDKVIDNLETLKREAADITKVEETDVIMQEVDQVTTQYLPLAQACSATFFILEHLSTINHFYQFSLRFFPDIFDHVLTLHSVASAIPPSAAFDSNVWTALITMCSNCILDNRPKHDLKHEFIALHDPIRHIIVHVVYDDDDEATQACAGDTSLRAPRHNAFCDLCKMDIDGVRWKCIECPGTCERVQLAF